MENIYVTSISLFISIFLTPITIRVCIIGIDLDDKFDVRCSIICTLIWAFGITNYMIRIL